MADDNDGEAGLCICRSMRTWVSGKLFGSGILPNPVFKNVARTAGEEKSAYFSVGVVKTPAAFGVAPFVLRGLEKGLLKPRAHLVSSYT